MKEYLELKNKIASIIEKSNNDKPACKNCKSFCDGACEFGCVNERNGVRYNFSNKKITTPDYFCNNFDAVYNFSESTLDKLRDLIEDIDRVNEQCMNFDLLLSGKISENDFNELLK